MHAETQRRSVRIIRRRRRCRNIRTRFSCRVKRIALIDGTDLLAELIAGYLAIHAGILVRSYSSTAEFLRAGDGAAFDLLLVDPFSKGVDGARDVARLVEAAGQVPVVLFTRELAPEHGPAMSGAGAAGLLSKRMDPPTLAAAVKALLDGLAMARRSFGRGRPESVPSPARDRSFLPGSDPLAAGRGARDAYRAASQALAPHPPADPRVGVSPAPVPGNSGDGRRALRFNVKFEVNFERGAGGGFF